MKTKNDIEIENCLKNIKDLYEDRVAEDVLFEMISVVGLILKKYMIKYQWSFSFSGFELTQDELQVFEVQLKEQTLAHHQTNMEPIIGELIRVSIELFLVKSGYGHLFK